MLGGDGEGLGGVAIDDAMVLMLSGLCDGMLTIGCWCRWSPFVLSGGVRVPAMICELGSEKQIVSTLSTHLPERAIHIAKAPAVLIRWFPATGRLQ